MSVPDPAPGSRAEQLTNHLNDLLGEITSLETTHGGDRDAWSAGVQTRITNLQTAITNTEADLAQLAERAEKVEAVRRAYQNPSNREAGAGGGVGVAPPTRTVGPSTAEPLAWSRRTTAAATSTTRWPSRYRAPGDTQRPEPGHGQVGRGGRKTPTTSPRLGSAWRTRSPVISTGPPPRLTPTAPLASTPGSRCPCPGPPRCSRWRSTRPSRSRTRARPGASAACAATRPSPPTPGTA